MDYQAAKFWLEIIVLASNCALWLWMFNLHKHGATNDRISALEHALTERMDANGRLVDERLDIHSKQLAQLNVHRETAPGHNDLKRLHERIDSVTTAISELIGESRGTRATVDLMHSYLLNTKP